jgi:hypothetical protein
VGVMYSWELGGVEPPATAQGVPSWLNGAVAGQWVQIANSTPSGTSNLEPSPLPPGDGGAADVVNAWGGATMRPSGSEFYLHGGGHGNYAGNEIYRLVLSDNAPTWTRVWGPSTNANISGGVDYYADGNPASMHSYYCLNWDVANDRLLRTLGGQYITSGLNTRFDSWPRNAANWNASGTHPSVPVAANAGAGVARDPTTGNLYVWYAGARAVWQASSNTWIFDDIFSSIQAYEGAIQVDPVRNCVWAVGGYVTSSGVVKKWDIATNVQSNVTVTGAGSGITSGNNSMAMGYVESLDKFYILTPSSVPYVFDPAALTIEPLTTSGTAPGTPASYGGNTGLWSRWQYAPELGGFAYLPAWGSPTFFLKVT